MNREMEMKRALWGEHISQLRENSKQYANSQDMIALYGSSSIRMWENMKNDLHPLHTINLGFGGSSYFWCDYFFEEVFEFISPSKVILYAGDNDLGSEVPEPDILNSVERLIDQISQKFGSIPIAIISVKPSPERSYLEKKIESLNSSLSAFINSRHNGTFIDIYAEMLNTNRAIRPELYLEDRLHINGKGYEIWRRVIQKHVADFMTG